MNAITFFGAAGGVTGSKHLLEINGRRLLLDCGLFQGLADVKERNRSLPFPPESIDAVVVSHAHLDHIGMLPLLVKRGFTGPIYATPATKDVAAHMLADMAGIEEQDAKYRQRHHIGAPDEREPLITADDVAPVINQFVEVPYQRHGKSWREVFPGMELKFYDAGHILGSAVSVIRWDNETGTKTLVYTGDLGPRGLPLLHDPEAVEDEAATLVLESTYGSRLHQPFEQAQDRLVDTINHICQRRGKIIVPAFSLGRTQHLVYVIHKLVDSKRIPRFPIYVDSPLAANITEIYQRHQEDYDEETRQDFQGHNHGPLAFRNLTYTRSVEESKSLNNLPGPAMIIASSGMMTAGRVIHHLRHNISDSNTAIFITGYQAEGTLGRRLLDGVRQIELLGEMFEVRASIELFNEFSAHADQKQLLEYAEKVKGLERVILVHGEPHHADDLKNYLAGRHDEWEVIRPDEGDIVGL